MESENNLPTSTRLSEYRLSWLAYARATIGLCILLLPVLLVAGLGYAIAKTLVPGIVAAVLALMHFVYHVFFLRSIVLYTNDEGVWVFSGILPWNKGSTGVKWRDLEDATFTTGFMSWAFRSYRVRIGHRFTKTSELIILNVKNGHEAVAEINKIHQSKLADLR